MSKSMCKLSFLLLACVFCISNASATIIVSGDASIAHTLSTTIPQIFNQGDQQFFENILNGSTDVAIVNQLGSNAYASEINTFYQSQSNINSTVISTISTASLGAADLLIIPMPDNVFSNEEMTLLNSYIDVGGSIFFLGECSSFSNKNAIINQTLLDIGSTMNIVNDTLDRGLFTAVGAQIVDGSAFTTNIQSFNYAFVSDISGGNPLFLTTNGTPFISYEQLRSVPEPSMAMFFLISLPVLGVLARKRNKK